MVEMDFPIPLHIPTHTSEHPPRPSPPTCLRGLHHWTHLPYRRLPAATTSPHRIAPYRVSYHQTKYGQLMSDVSYIDSVLAAGAEAAAATADRTLADARDAMGFVPPFKRK